MSLDDLNPREREIAEAVLRKLCETVIKDTHLELIPKVSELAVEVTSRRMTEEDAMLEINACIGQLLLDGKLAR